MNVGGGLPGGEAWRDVGWLLKDPKATPHSAPDDGVVVELDGDVPHLRDLPLVAHANGEEVWGHIDPESLGAFIRGIAVQRGLSRGDGAGYLPLHILMRFDDHGWTSPPPVLSPSSSSSASRHRGDFLPFFSVDCGVAVSELDKVLSLLR